MGGSSRLRRNLVRFKHLSYGRLLEMERSQAFPRHCFLLFGQLAAFSQVHDLGDFLEVIDVIDGINPVVAILGDGHERQFGDSPLPSDLIPFIASNISSRLRQT